MPYSTEIKEAAKRLYLRRAKPREIQAELGLPNVRIVYYWIARGTAARRQPAHRAATG